jgi:GTP-binding protein
MRFADYAKIYVNAGNGGSGSVHFRREKYVPKGGPDGGDGGRGGDVVLRGQAQLGTLLDLRYRKVIKAAHGSPGQSSCKTGRSGSDTVLDVPVGTVAYDADSRELIGEVMEQDQTLVVAQGGKGGLGNWHFKSSTHQSPQYAQDGMTGQERVVELELKLLADVGLVGFPNAGKSTLLSVLSDAKPKIADYPFTTLEPNLGVAMLPDYRSFVVADIPGIIVGAHEGKGLGLQFLRHIERNQLLLFVVSCESDIRREYDDLIAELRAYDPVLLALPRMLVITKMDLHPGHETELELPDEKGLEILKISSATGHCIDVLKEAIWSTLRGKTAEEH